MYLCEIAILKAAPGTILATGGGATGTRLRCVYRLPTTSTRLQTLLSFRVQGERRPMASKSFVHFRSHLKGLYGGFRTLVSRSYYYLRRRSPGPPFPPDASQAGEHHPAVCILLCVWRLVDLYKGNGGRTTRPLGGLSFLTFYPN